MGRKKEVKDSIDASREAQLDSSQVHALEKVIAERVQQTSIASLGAWKGGFLC